MFESVKNIRKGKNVNDTSQLVGQRVRDLMKQKTGEERLMMGCSMHEFSKKLVITSLQDKDPNISPESLRREIFLRFYGHDFAEPYRQNILEYISYCIF